MQGSMDSVRECRLLPAEKYWLPEELKEEKFFLHKNLHEKIVRPQLIPVVLLNIRGFFNGKNLSDI